jgi:hypothetical protein
LSNVFSTCFVAALSFCANSFVAGTKTRKKIMDLKKAIYVLDAVGLKQTQAYSFYFFF